MPGHRLRPFAPVSLPETVPRLLTAGGGTVADAAYRHDAGRRVGRYVTVQISLAGGGMVWSDGGPGTPVPAGSGFLFRAREPGVVYGFPPGRHPPWRFVYAEIGGAAALAMAADVIARRGRVLPAPADRQAVVALRRLVERGGPDAIALPGAASCEAACALLALLADGAVPERGADEALARAALDWLAARLDRGIGVADAAAALGVSREHLSRTFARVVGMPPGAWLLRERLARGEHLLRGTRWTVRAVAAACGLGDPGHFAAAFARRYGVAPSRYRRRLAGAASASGAPDPAGGIPTGSV